MDIPSSAELSNKSSVQAPAVDHSQKGLTDLQDKAQELESRKSYLRELEEKKKWALAKQEAKLRLQEKLDQRTNESRILTASVNMPEINTCTLEEICLTSARNESAKVNPEVEGVFNRTFPAQETVEAFVVSAPDTSAATHDATSPAAAPSVIDLQTAAETKKISIVEVDKGCRRESEELPVPTEVAEVIEELIETLELLDEEEQEIAAAAAASAAAEPQTPPRMHFSRTALSPIREDRESESEDEEGDEEQEDHRCPPEADSIVCKSSPEMPCQGSADAKKAQNPQVPLSYS